MPRTDFDEQAGMHLRTLFNEPLVSADAASLLKQTSFSPKRIGPGFYPMMPRQRQALLRDVNAQAHKLLKHADGATLASHLYFTLDAGRQIGFDPIQYIDVPAGTDLRDVHGNSFIPDTSFSLPAHTANHFSIAQSAQNPTNRRYAGLMEMDALEEMLVASFLLVEMHRADSGAEDQNPSYQITSVEPTADPFDGLQAKAYSPQAEQRLGVLMATPLAIASLQQDRKNLRTQFEHDASRRSKNTQLVVPVIQRFDGMSVLRNPHPALSKHVTAMGLRLT